VPVLLGMKQRYTPIQPHWREHRLEHPVAGQPESEQLYNVELPYYTPSGHFCQKTRGMFASTHHGAQLPQDPHRPTRHVLLERLTLQ
jgi:hypothetical protein